MADEQLRRREREARKGANPGELIAAARSHLRAGRPEEAFWLLWPARAAREVEAELCLLPSCTQHDLWFDVPLPRSAPRLLWARDDGFAGDLLAGPAGLVAARPDLSRVFDPVDGALLSEHEGQVMSLQGEELVLQKRGGPLTWLPLRGKRSRGSIPFEDTSCRVAGDLALYFLEGAIDVYARGVRKRRWRKETPPWAARPVLGPGVAVLDLADEEAGEDGRRRPAVIDLASGELRFRLPPGRAVAADEQGFVVSTDRSLLFCGREGRQLLEHPSVLLSALGATHYVDGAARDRLRVFERGTGRQRSDLKVPRAWRCLLGRDAVLWWEERTLALAAVTLEGETLWQVALDHAPHALLAWAGRLFVLQQRTWRVLCFGEERDGR